MTWSIIAHDEATGRIGIAVASRAFAVGARVPHIRAGIGAVATQAWTNPFFGPRGLALLAAGATAEDAVRMLMTADEGRDHRQVHMLARGEVQQFAGESVNPGRESPGGRRLGCYSAAIGLRTGHPTVSSTSWIGSALMRSAKSLNTCVFGGPALALRAAAVAGSRGVEPGTSERAKQP